MLRAAFGAAALLALPQCGDLRPPQTEAADVSPPLAGAGNAGLFFTSNPLAPSPQNRFSCEEKIYAFLSFSSPRDDTLVMEGVWRGPDGTVRERPRIEMKASPDEKKSVYFWISFADHLGWEGLGFFSNEDRRRFDGVWRFEGRLNHQEIAASTFTVVCS